MTDMRHLGLLALCATLASCDPGPTKAQTLAQVQAIKDEALGNIVRQEGECRAIAVEFHNDPLMDKNCQDSYRLTVEMARRTIANAEKRISDLKGQ